MKIKGMNLCDFCFEPVTPRGVCPKCGLSHSTYRPEVGLLMPGTDLLGKYIIGRVLGRGGFGVTYLAYSLERDEVVAIKEYYPTGIANRAKGEEKISIISADVSETFNSGAKRLYEEAEMMARFNAEKNVVSVYEIFYANGTVYYSMEYLNGIDLKGYVVKKGGKLRENEAATIMRGICDALVTVHSTQMLHRDIAPDNVYICSNGDVKLIDFGAAKQIVNAYGQQNFSVVLKQGFAPIEQYKSNGKQGVWTDIYAVGATIYYAISGETPADPLSRFDDGGSGFDKKLNISYGFRKLIEKCMEIKPEDRYQSAVEVLGALEALAIPAVAVGNERYSKEIQNHTVTTAITGSNVTFASKQKKQASKNKKTDLSRIINKKSIVASCAALAIIAVSAVSVKLVVDRKSGQIIGGVTPSQAVTENSYVKDYAVKVLYNGSAYPLTHPLINNSDTYMIAEHDLFTMLGVTSTRENDILVINYNDMTCRINVSGNPVSDSENEIVNLETPPINDNGVTMLPFAQTAGVLGIDVAYDAEAKAINVTTEQAAVEEPAPTEEPAPEATSQNRETNKETKKPVKTAKPAASKTQRPAASRTQRPAAVRTQTPATQVPVRTQPPQTVKPVSGCPVCGSTNHTSHPEKAPDILDPSLWGGVGS